MTDLGLPYRPATRQEQGLVTERQVLRERGARQHPRSGAGRIKQDGSTEDAVIEVKDANRSFTLSGTDLLAAWIDATRQGKDSVWVIRFRNGMEAELVMVRRTTTH